MACELVGLTGADIADRWDDIGPKLESIAARSNGRLSARTLAEAVIARDMQLWAAVSDGIDAVMVTEILVNPTGKKVCVVLGCAGRGAKQWAHMMPLVEDWARQQGCTGMQAIARRGWGKLLNWKQTHVFIEKDI